MLDLWSSIIKTIWCQLHWRRLFVDWVPCRSSRWRHNLKEMSQSNQWQASHLVEISAIHYTLQRRHNEHDGVSIHQPHDLFGCRSKKTSKLRVTGLCAGNSPVTGEFPAQMASYAVNVSNWWRHHEVFAARVSYNFTILITDCMYHKDRPWMILSKAIALMPSVIVSKVACISWRHLTSRAHVINNFSIKPGLSAVKTRWHHILFTTIINTLHHNSKFWAPQVGHNSGLWNSIHQYVSRSSWCRSNHQV